MLKRVWRIGLLVLLLGPLAGTFSAIAQCGETPCPPPPSPPPAGFISVLVVVDVAGAPECDIAKKPIEGAKVTLLSKAERVFKDKVLAEGFTNKEGKFAAWIIIFGRNPQEAVTNLEVDVKKEGFEPKPKRVISMVVTIPFFGTFILTNVCLQRKELDLQIFKLDGTKLGNDEEGEPADEETIGSLNCVNLDNDDGPAQKDDFDLRDDNVPGENDLVKLVIAKPKGVDGEKKVKLSITKGADKVKVWEKQTKETEELPKEPKEKEYKVSELPKELWVEGIKGSSGERDVEFKLEPVDFEAESDKVALTVVNVTAIAFVGRGNSIRDDDNLDADPHPSAPAGTVRVFPDKRSHTDADARDKVKVKVELSAPVPDALDIYLKALDVDDPSANSTPVDDEANEEDNRGNVGGSKAGRLKDQDADGIAKLSFARGDKEKEFEDFQVTKQPGDNFRIAVSCDKEFLKNLRNKDDEDGIKIVDKNNKKEIEGWVSPVLTVWRRLHIEADTMATPGNANTVNGIITQVNGPDANGNCEVTINQQLEQADQYHKVAGDPPGRGDLKVGEVHYPVVGNNTLANSVVRVRAAKGACPAVNAAFTLHDDDDDALLPATPDTSLFEEKLAPAYVLPKILNNPNDHADFDKNTEDIEATNVNYASYGKWDTRGHNDNDYWVSYLLSVFQGPLTCDNDPESEPECDLGFRPAENISIVYREGYKDACERGGAANTGEAGVWLHELGHQFSGDHNDGGVMTQGCNKPSLDFTNETLNRIRSTQRPGA